MQARTWICPKYPDETTLRKAAAAYRPQIEHAVLAALRARGLLTDTEYRRCSALLVQPLP